MNQDHAQGAVGGLTIFGAIVAIIMHQSYDFATASGYAVVILSVLGCTYALLQWYLNWQWPNAPTLPDLAAAAADATARAASATAAHQAALVQASLPPPSPPLVRPVVAVTPQVIPPVLPQTTPRPPV